MVRRPVSGRVGDGGRPRGCFHAGLVSVAFIARSAGSSCRRACGRALISVYSGLYLRQMDGQPHQRSLAGHAVVPLRHRLHARLVPADGRAKIGKGAEISTNLGGPLRSHLDRRAELHRRRRARSAMKTSIAAGLTLRRTTIGIACSSATTPSSRHGARPPEGTLIGVKSNGRESNAAGRAKRGSARRRSRFPVRQQFGDLGANWTYQPSLLTKIGRADFRGAAHHVPDGAVHHLGLIAVESFGRAALLQRLSICGALGVFVALRELLDAGGDGADRRRRQMGRHGRLCVAVAKPMWSWWAMRTEAVAACSYWGLAGKVLLEHVRGTSGCRCSFGCCGARRWAKASTWTPPT